MIAFEVLLAVLTAGAGTALSAASKSKHLVKANKALQGIAKIVKRKRLNRVQKRPVLKLNPPKRDIAVRKTPKLEPGPKREPLLVNNQSTVKPKPAPRTVDQILVNGKIPTVRKGFNKWFDELTPEELKSIISDPKMYDTIAQRFRNGGGKHEWLMVREMQKVKEWGVPMNEIHRFTSKTTDLKWINPNTGKPGAHTVIVDGVKQTGPGSKSMHLELQNMIKESNNLDDFNKGMIQLRERWSIDPNLIPDLPKLNGSPQ